MKLIHYFAAVCALSLVSCIDSTYDLTQPFNTHIAVLPGRTTLPLGDTEKVMMSELIEETDQIKIKDDQYYFYAVPHEFPTEVSIHPITLNIPKVQFSQLQIPLAPSRELRHAFVYEESMSFNQEVGEEILDLMSASFLEGEDLNLVFKIKIDVPWDQVKEVKLSGLHFEFPPYLQIKDTSGYLKNLEREVFVVGPEGIEFNVELLGLDFSYLPKGTLHSSNGSLKLSTNNLVSITGEIFAVTLASVDKDARLTMDVSVNADSLPLGVVKGHFFPKIATIVESQQLDWGDDLGSKEKEVAFRLVNPMLYLDFQHPLPIPLVFDMSLMLCSSQGDSDSSTFVHLSDLAINAPLLGHKPRETHYLVSAVDTFKQGYEVIYTTQLRELLDHFVAGLYADITLLPDLSVPHTLDLNQSTKSKMQITTQVVAPLVFDSLLISYTEVFDSLVDDLKFVADQSREVKLALSGTVENALPLDVILSVNLRDAQCQVIESIRIEELVIDAMQENEPIVKDFLLKLSIPAGVVQDIDAMAIDVLATHSKEKDDMSLRSSQYIQLQNLALSFEGAFDIEL